MAKDKITMPNTTMGKHDRLQEEKADRAKGHSVTPAAREQEERVAATVESDPEPTPHAPSTSLNGPMLLRHVQTVLKDRYPHNDIRALATAFEVKVPGVIIVEFEQVNRCKNINELRAYIDALPIL